uniref:Uncharacterized protein n=1 Tax=Aegilops tauschii TaxID=37682 RepID=N1QPQ4_AEGTA
MEDEILVSYINDHGEGKWGSLPKRAGLNRCGKSCRLRWLNYLRPGIKRGNISDDEEELIGIELGFMMSPWSGGADGVGDQHFGAPGAEADGLEELLGLGVAGGGGDGHGGLGDLELAWLC